MPPKGAQMSEEQKAKQSEVMKAAWEKRKANGAKPQAPEDVFAAAHNKVVPIGGAAPGGSTSVVAAPGNNLPPAGGGGTAGTVRPDVQIGRNLDSKTGAPAAGKPDGTKTVKVALDIEKVKKGVPAFYKLCLKAMNNVCKLVNIVPLWPFELSFEDATTEEADIFTEAAWPGMEAALPDAAKKHPIFFLLSAFFVGILGKLKVAMKESWKNRGSFLKKKEPENKPAAPQPTHQGTVSVNQPPIQKQKEQSHVENRKGSENIGGLGSDLPRLQ